VSVPFGEAAILNDGRRVVAPWKAPGIYVGEVFHDGPELRMPDSALTAAGNVWVLGRRQADDVATVWLDAVGLWWPVPYKTFGSRMILRANGEGCLIAFTTSATSWLCLNVTPAGSMSIASSGAIPSGEGGQGMRDWLLGTPRPMAPLDHTLLGYKVRGEVTVGSVTLATALGPLPDQVVMAKDGKIGTLLQGQVDWPTLRISPNEQHWVGAMYVGERVVGGRVPDVVPALYAPLSVPSIGRPMWMACFNFQPATTPGNAVLNTSDLIVRDAHGLAVAQYVASPNESDPNALDTAIAAAKSKGLPVIAYWTRAAQGIRLPNGAEIVGVEAYHWASESLAAFEARVRAAVARCPKAALICQAYTSNASLTTDLASLVPIYARIAKDCGNVWGLLVFSGSGRPTGLQDHPDVLPLWQALAAGIPSAPQTEEFMEPWLVKFDESYSKVIAKGVGAVARCAIGNGIDVEWQKGADDTIHFAVYEDGTLRNRSSLPRHVDVRG
jgi:hypothetical protein